MISKTSHNIQSFYHFCSETLWEPVAFSAFHNQEVIYQKNDIIQFDGVDLNEGESYQNQNGYFICPMNGIYGVSAHILSPLNFEMNGSIMKEKTRIAEFESDYSADLRLSSGNFVVTKCLVGERLWVRSDVNNAKTTWGSRFTTFSGFLVQEI